MFRPASLILGAIVLIAGVHYRPFVCNALDDVKAGPQKQPDEFEKYDIGEIEETPPTELMVDPTLESPAKAAPAPGYQEDGKVIKPKVGEPAIVPRPGSKGNEGFGGRGSGSRKAMLATGGTKRTERTVTAALVWLANHQMSDGSWSLQNYTQRCKDKSCTGKGQVSADAGATALGLLPFFAAGQTHKSKGPYREHILQGIQWLITHQQPDGNLAKGVPQMMYSHGLATIVLSEAYGLSDDKHVGEAAQKAVNFILAAQNATDGGWRYNPKDPGDTSVLGWQLTALKSAKMAGLNVGGNVFAHAGKFLDSVAIHDGTEYGYTLGGGSSPTMTAVGLLGRQYLGVKRDSPMLTGGMKYLMDHLPDESLPNVYYWYYATQVMHNMNGYEWDTWNRKMRDLLVRNQVHNSDSCANGSWDPSKDAWGRHGGRVMQTSLSVLPLMVYYHGYLPLFKAEAADSDSTVAKPKEEIAPKEQAEKSKQVDDTEVFINPPPAKSSTDPNANKTAQETQTDKPRDEQKPPDPGSRSTEHKERTVTAGLIWLANHQLFDGSWSLHDYTKQCTDKTCTGQSDISSDAGATALGLLPFLGAGQTHKSKGPYKEHIQKGIEWLIRHQQPDGNLAKGSAQMMYGHGLATITLSEAYDLSGDKRVGMAAQKAVNFILAAQNTTDGGWRYNPGDPGDTCVLGWQLTALKSAYMVGLTVSPDTFSNASKYLDSVAIRDGVEYAYVPGAGSSNTMTAVGLMGRQYLGAKRDNPMLTGGVKYLMNRLPDEKAPNIYYWYYGTQVMHNMGGVEWDAWNRKLRDLLIRSQIRDETCANGSWDPSKDAWGRRGGRVMETSLAVLALETYYRYLPIFKCEVADMDSTAAKPSEENAPDAPVKPDEKPDTDPFGSPAKPMPVPPPKPVKDADNDPFG